MLYRNPILLKATGLHSSEKFQVVFLETWEYIPTFIAKAFAPQGMPQAHERDLVELKEVIREADPVSLFNGSLGRKLQAQLYDTAYRMMFAGVARGFTNQFRVGNNLAIAN